MLWRRRDIVERPPPGSAGVLGVDSVRLPHRRAVWTAAAPRAPALGRGGHRAVVRRWVRPHRLLGQQRGQRRLEPRRPGRRGLHRPDPGRPAIVASAARSPSTTSATTHRQPARSSSAASAAATAPGRPARDPSAAAACWARTCAFSQRGRHRHARLQVDEPQRGLHARQRHPEDRRHRGRSGDRVESLGRRHRLSELHQRRDANTVRRQGRRPREVGGHVLPRLRPQPDRARAPAPGRTARAAHRRTTPPAGPRRGSPRAPRRAPSGRHRLTPAAVPAPVPGRPGKGW